MRLGTRARDLTSEGRRFNVNDADCKFTRDIAHF